ncbi:hypothetical protein C7402_107142 [Paraburkholderia unamae]|uniref:Lipoprotein n=1 Tax=Paraburkholderia unamae TaxID=219649 RepID=A0ABX5KR15_9BURK|nr:hypothetical protein C7402_107142 [Paraburkholderia unamae]
MSVPTPLILAGCIVWSLAACSSSPPKPVLPDGLHRVPVNRVLPVPDVPAAPETGDRS